MQSEQREIHFLQAIRKAMTSEAVSNRLKVEVWCGSSDEGYISVSINQPDLVVQHPMTFSYKARNSSFSARFELVQLSISNSTF